MSPVQIQVTRNFRRNLDEIEEFLAEAESPAVFGRLIDDLFESIIPRLEAMPHLGADFLKRSAASHEAATLLVSLCQRLGPETSLRELIHGDYLILYAQKRDVLYLLAIKHHRQLSFDFADRWSG